MQPRNPGRTVLITGASSGIGRACALLFAREGYRVFGGVRTVEAGRRLQSEASGEVVPVLLDITSRDQVRAAVKTLVAACGPARGLDALVNSAGVVPAGPLELFPLADLRRAMEVNVVGQVAVVQAFLPLLRRAQGRVVNISSPSGFLAPPFLGAYAASKFALEALTDALRRETARFALRVSLVEPGAVETPVWDRSLLESAALEAGFTEEGKALYADRLARGRKMMARLRGRAMQPEEVARSVLRVLEARRPRPRYFVGADARLQHLLARFFPGRLVDWLVEKAMGAAAHKA